MRRALIAILVTVVTLAAQPIHAARAAADEYVPRWKRVARSLLGTPYVYGGSSRYGMDCSGFVRYVVGSVAHHWLSHNAAAMAYEVPAISTSEIQPGDILFFDYFGTGIDHVEIAYGDGLMVGTSNVVEDLDIDPIDWSALVKVGRIPALTADVRAHLAAVHRHERLRLQRLEREAAALVARISTSGLALSAHATTQRGGVYVPV